MIVAEGNVFQNVALMVDTSSVGGKIFTAPTTSANTACKTYLGHNCELNAFGSSTGYTGTDTSFFSNFSGKNVAAANTAAWTQSNVPSAAGIGKV
jgi:pectin lyase